MRIGRSTCQTAYHRDPPSKEAFGFWARNGGGSHAASLGQSPLDKEAAIARIGLSGCLASRFPRQEESGDIMSRVRSGNAGLEMALRVKSRDVCNNVSSRLIA
jgi:hypothetical protein